MEWDAFKALRGGVLAEPVAPGVVRLSERGLRPGCRSFFYRIDTPDCAVLIDGGWGLARSRADLGLAPEKPLIAIATHSHSDHVGALHLAETRLAHAAEAPVYDKLDPYETQARPWIDDLDFAADGTAVAPETYRQIPCPLTGTLADGARLDYGPDLRLTVLHLPGHSPGSIALLDEARGLLYTADTVHDGEIYDAIPGADRIALRRSHDRVLEVEFAQALPGHGALMSRSAVVERIERYRRERDRP